MPLALARYSAFQPGELWRDSQGNIIDAHGAGFLKDGNLYYWYGETRHGEPSSQESCFENGNDALLRSSAGYTPGVNLYVSDGDLYNWKHIGLVFPANVTRSHCLERPKVIRCPATGEYVLWAKGFPADGSVRAVIAAASTPLGPFQLIDPAAPFYAPDGKYTFADATLYVDEVSRKPYVFFRTREDGLHLGELTHDCKAIKGQSTYIADKSHEAPAVFQADGKVYLWTSGTSGFSGNPAKLLVSNTGSVLGPYAEVGNPTHDSSTFRSQSTYILPNPSYKTDSSLPPFIYVADRWQQDTTNFGTYVWLPLYIRQNGQVVVNNASWWQYQSSTASEVVE